MLEAKKEAIENFSCDIFKYIIENINHENGGLCIDCFNSIFIAFARVVTEIINKNDHDAVITNKLKKDFKHILDFMLQNGSDIDLDVIH